ncbi:hypothetical protein CCAND95_780001 [Capnocytophaga canis]|nr:hypothetical protein CCAND95_780001 [Capnocytophaga canis]
MYRYFRIRQLKKQKSLIRFESDFYFKEGGRPELTNSAAPLKNKKLQSLLIGVLI